MMVEKPLRQAGTLSSWRQVCGGHRAPIPTMVHTEEVQFSADRLARCRIAVESRSRHWLKDNNLETTLGFLRQNAMSYVAVL